MGFLMVIQYNSEVFLPTLLVGEWGQTLNCELHSNNAIG